MEVEEEGEWQCWACGNPRVEIAHIVGKQDTAIQFLDSKGLINFNLKSERNAMALCPICHAEFDDMMNPGFVFWPEDLQYFIDFELRDRARRRRLPSSDQMSRRVPTARQYREHQRATSHSGEACGWGYYRRIHLANIHERRATEDMPFKQWRGAPLAALRRAIAVIGCPRSARIPADDLEKLQILRDLYYGEWEKEEDVEKRLGIDPFAQPPDEIDEFGSGDTDASKESGEDEEDEEDEEWSPPAKRRKIKRRVETPTKFNYRNWRWDFGPQSSSEDKRRGYAPQLMGPRAL